MTMPQRVVGLGIIISHVIVFRVKDNNNTSISKVYASDVKECQNDFQVRQLTVLYLHVLIVHDSSDSFLFVCIFGV